MMLGLETKDRVTSRATIICLLTIKLQLFFPSFPQLMAISVEIVALQQKKNPATGADKQVI